MPKISFMRFTAHLDTPPHGPPNPFKDAGVITDSLTGVYNIMVKCFFVVNWSFIHKAL
jgi:hypothetical protein